MKSFKELLETRTKKNIEDDIQRNLDSIKMYQTLMKGGTVDKKSVSYGRYQGYIVNRKEEIIKLKAELKGLK